MSKIISVVAAALFFLYLLVAPQTQQKKPPQKPPTQPVLTAVVPQVIITSPVVITTLRPSDTPLTFASLTANTTYTMTCTVYFSGTSRVMQVAITGPPNPSTLGYSFDHVLVGALSGAQNNIASSFGTVLGLANNTPTPDQKLNSIITMGLVTGTLGGTVTVQAAAPSGTVTIYPGSFCRMQ